MWNRRYYYREKIKKAACWALIIILLPYIVTVFVNGPKLVTASKVDEMTIDVKGGTPTSAGEILQMAVSQKAFFGKKGGITFSGGEPTLQAEALIPLFKDLKANGIHICLDTNDRIWNDKVEELLSLTDLVLLDI